MTAEGIWVDPKQFPDIKVRVFSTLVNPNILAGYLVLVIAYSTAFFNQTKAYKKWRLVFLDTGILAALCLLYTYSRGNWVACAVMLLAFCVLFCCKAFIPILGGSAGNRRYGCAASSGFDSGRLWRRYVDCTANGLSEKHEVDYRGISAGRRLVGLSLCLSHV